MTPQVDPTLVDSTSNIENADEETPVEAWLAFAEATSELNSSLDGAGAWPKPARPRDTKPGLRRR